MTFNYRLGALGFLAHPELTTEAPYRASGNYGLFDMIAALRWVQENIGAFGADPGRVTIAGQSAGAQEIHHLTASPLARGLFHRAIIESGSQMGTFATSGRSMAAQEADGVRFAALKGAGSLAALRAATWQQIIAALPPIPSGASRPTVTGSVVDSYALPASPPPC